MPTRRAEVQVYHRCRSCSNAHYEVQMGERKIHKYSRLRHIPILPVLEPQLAHNSPQQGGPQTQSIQVLCGLSCTKENELHMEQPAIPRFWSQCQCRARVCTFPHFIGSLFNPVFIYSWKTFKNFKNPHLYAFLCRRWTYYYLEQLHPYFELPILL